MYFTCAGRADQLQNQHVLRHPAFVARLHRCDTQRMTLLRPAARCRRSRNRTTRSRASPGNGRCISALHCSARSSPADWAPAARRPNAVRGTNSPSSPRTSSTRFPTRVMMCMLTTTYAESVISTPILALGEPNRAHAVGNDVHRAAHHRAREQPVSFCFIFAGSSQLLVGPASSLVREQIKSLFDAGHIGRIGADQKAVGTLRGIQRNSGSGQDQQPQHRLIFFRRAVAPVNAIGFAHLRDFFDPALQLGVAT